MSSKDMDRNEEHRIHREREDFEYSRKGLAEEVGIIAKGSAGNSENNSVNTRKNQEKRFYEQLLKALLNTPSDVDNLLDEMGKENDNIRQNINRAKAYQEAYKSGDLEQLVILLGEDGLDANELNSPQEVLDAAQEQYKKYLSEARTSIQFVKASNQKIQNSEVSSDQQKEDSLDKILSMESLEIELNTLGSLHKPCLEGSKFQERFIELAENEASTNSALNLDNREEREGKSFASAENDPFAEVADSITDPFNEVAQNILKQETKNDLEKEVVSSLNPKVPNP